MHLRTDPVATVTTLTDAHKRCATQVARDMTRSMCAAACAQAALAAMSEEECSQWVSAAALWGGTKA